MWKMETFNRRIQTIELQRYRHTFAEICIIYLFADSETSLENFEFNLLKYVGLLLCFVYYFLAHGDRQSKVKGGLSPYKKINK